MSFILVFGKLQILFKNKKARVMCVFLFFTVNDPFSTAFYVQKRNRRVCSLNVQESDVKVTIAPECKYIKKDESRQL